MRIDGTEKLLEEPRFRCHERAPFIGAVGAVTTPDPGREVSHEPAGS